MYYNTICQQNLSTLYNSVTHITEYPKHILEFHLQEIDDAIVMSIQTKFKNM